MQRIDVGYVARPQFEAFHRRKTRWAVVVAHRRCGKTVACIMDLVDAALRCQRPDGRYAYVAPFYAQAKDVAWGYLKRFTAQIPNATVNESELRVDLPNGARIKLYGADNYDRMRGIYFDEVVLDEVADFDPRAWPEVIRPALSDRQGRAVFIGTPKGPNSFYEIWQEAERSPEWFTLMLRASETGILSADELADARRTMTADQYAQEYECSFTAAVRGAYYAAEMERMRAEGRVGRVPLDRYVPVHTSWDLGVADQTSIWFVQQVGREIRLVDYYEASGVGLDHYVSHLRAWLAERPGLRWGTHYFPHDIQARELSTGRSRLETLRTLGLDNVEVVPQHAVLEGINAVRMMLDRAWIDEVQCARGLRCLQMYRSDFDEKNGVFRPKPVHDEYSHGADALRMFACVYSDTGPAGTRPDAYRRGATRAPSSGWMTA